MKKRYLGLLIIIGIGFGVITFINKKIIYQKMMLLEYILIMS